MTTRKARLRNYQQQQTVDDEGQKRYPDHVGKNDVHGEITADQEDAVAKAGGRCNCLGRNQKYPCPARVPRRMELISCPARSCGRTRRVNICQTLAPECFGLDDHFARNVHDTDWAVERIMTGAVPTHNQHAIFGRFAQAQKQ